MVEILQTEAFLKWRSKLKDDQAKALISFRLDRLLFGHFGDASPVGDGVSELRIHYGPGYRLYFHRRGERIIVLLCGGDKDTQARDIKKAKLLAREWGSKHG